MFLRGKGGNGCTQKEELKHLESVVDLRLVGKRREMMVMEIKLAGVF